MEIKITKLKVKEVATATSKGISFEQEKISDTCFCCGKSAKSITFRKTSSA